jgi:cytochrome c oxidase accessory protein FixG
VGNNYDFHKTRLSTTDEKGRRVYIFADEIKGYWDKWRNRSFFFLICFFLVLPWLRYADQQTILLDIPNREFVFFGNTFYGHDAPFISYLLFLFIIGAAAVTSYFGRAWCGWACPQTVFTHGIFMKIESWVEGNARKRRQLSKHPLSFNTILKKILKWSLFLLVSLHISHSFLGYFVGTRELFNISLHSPEENLTLFITMLSITALLLFDFGWFREQFCTIACPYGRIQSVFMDDDSSIIAYDKTRGEPRRNQKIDLKDEGDCIDCFQCVKVCPTGIDIRRGTQLECIACTKCIDACDNIMDKLSRPKGLIKFSTENKLNNIKTKKIKLRTFVYFTILLTLLLALITNLRVRTKLSMNMVRGSQDAYQVIKTSKNKSLIVNHYRLNFNYPGNKLYKLTFIVNNSKVEVVTPIKPFIVNKQYSSTPVFFKFNKSILVNGNKKIVLKVLNNKTIVLEKEFNLVGPY